MASIFACKVASNCWQRAICVARCAFNRSMVLSTSAFSSCAHFSSSSSAFRCSSACCFARAVASLRSLCSRTCFSRSAARCSSMLSSAWSACSAANAVANAPPSLLLVSISELIAALPRAYSQGQGRDGGGRPPRRGKRGVAHFSDQAQIVGIFLTSYRTSSAIRTKRCIITRARQQPHRWLLRMLRSALKRAVDGGAVHRRLGASRRALSNKIRAPPMVYIRGEEMTKYTMDVSFGSSAALLCLLFACSQHHFNDVRPSCLSFLLLFLRAAHNGKVDRAACRHLWVGVV